MIGCVWSLISSLEEKQKYREYYEKSSVYRKNKADRYNVAKDRYRTIAAGNLVYEALRAYRNYTPALLCNKTNSASQSVSKEAIESFVPEESVSACGKPYLSEYPSFYYSISHSGDYVVCLYSDYSKVGVDLQEHRTVVKSFENHFFSDREREYFYSKKTETEQTLTLFEIWAAHESYIKMTEKGSIFNQNLSYDVEQKIMYDRNQKRLSYIQTIPFKSGYTLCICDIMEQNLKTIIEIEL